MIINCKNRAENLITNQWVEGRKECMELFNKMTNTLRMFRQHKEVTIFIKKPAVLLNLGQFPDKLMHILESKFTKIKELSTIYKAKNKKT